MTTIAYKNGVMAADRLCTKGGLVTGTVRKVWKSQGLLYGVAGSISAVQQIMKWSKGDRNRLPTITHNVPFCCMVVAQRGQVFEFSNDDRDGCILTCDQYAIGSGADLALGAMLAGSGARRAVRLACDLDVHSGGGIDVIRL